MNTSQDTTDRHFWVVGGEFTSLQFATCVPGTERVVGPIPSRDMAEQVWRELSEQYRAQAAVRFSIVTAMPRV